MNFILNNPETVIELKSVVPDKLSKEALEDLDNYLHHIKFVQLQLHCSGLNNPISMESEVNLGIHFWKSVIAKYGGEEHLDKLKRNLKPDRKGIINELKYIKSKDFKLSKRESKQNS